MSHLENTFMHCVDPTIDLRSHGNHQHFIHNSKHQLFQRYISLVGRNFTFVAYFKTICKEKYLLQSQIPLLEIPNYFQLQIHNQPILK